jgi:L-iditol 2-dehydrogenase
MIQAIMTEPGKIKFQEVEEKVVADNQKKVKIKCIGVCGSDIHVFHGKHPYTSYPVVQGHEVSAVVVQIGKDVTNVKVGDVVVIQPQVVCGRCYSCTHGMYNACENLKVMGFQTTGMASEYFVVDAQKALKLPDGMSFEHGAMLEPLAVAVHAVRRFGSVKDKGVVVLGGGTIGNLVAQTVKALGAEKVLLSEISSYRLQTAQKCGIETVNPESENLKDTIRNVFGENGADVIFECVGINTTMKHAIEYARKGSDIIVVGVFADLGTINMGFVQDHELRLTGTAMYRTEDFQKAIQLVNQGLIEFDALITNRVKFKDYLSAYQTIDEKKDEVMKIR